METCAGCRKPIDPAFDTIVRDRLGRPWHTPCMVNAGGANHPEDRVRGSNPLAWALVTVFFPVAGFVVGLIYLFRNKVGPGLALIIESVALFALYSVLISAASANWQAPEQEHAGPGVAEVATSALAFWRARGLVTCPDDVTVWQAPHLIAGDGDAWGRGDGATCEIWVSDDLASVIDYPVSGFGTALDACQAVTHEVGHALGLPHSPMGVMAAVPPPRHHAWTPYFCYSWAKQTLAAVMRGDYPERTIRRLLEAAAKRTQRGGI